MLGIWNEIGKRWPYALLIVIGVTAFCAADAQARTPTMAEWNQEAYREARRECFRHQTPPVEFGLRKITCVDKGHWEPDAGPCYRATLANLSAKCAADFAVKYNWGKYEGLLRLYRGTVSMFYAGDKRVRRPKGAKYVPIIQVARRSTVWRPVAWIVDDEATEARARTSAYMRPVSPKAHAAHVLSQSTAKWALQCGNGDCDISDQGIRYFNWGQFWYVTYPHDARQQITHGGTCKTNFQVYYPNTSNTVYDKFTYSNCFT